MSYQALARKYRPQTFEDIVGQETVVRTLHNAIEQERIHHAYLFSGVRGVGKTTAARILAKALNCVNGPTPTPCNTCTICREITEGIDLDVREIDAATYTQVENVRELREVTQFQPARDRNRIFIIDEAHMLSTAAWNALLKLIEEPPPHVVFVLATTEMQKVPQTILSRVQQFVFRKLTQSEVQDRLAVICRSEGIEAESEALEIVARRGEGSVRDSLSLLDQVIAFGGRSLLSRDVTTILGLSNGGFLAELSELIGSGDAAGLLAKLDEAAAAGRDFKLLFRDFMTYARNMLLVATGASSSLITVPPEDLEALKRVSSAFEPAEILRVLNLLMQDAETINRAEHQRLAVEISFLKAATLPRLRSIESILAGDAAAAPVQRGSQPARPSAAADRPTPKAPLVAPMSSKAEPAPRPPARSASTVELPARPAAQTGKTPEPAARPAAGDPGAALIEKVREKRRVMASYLEQASELRFEDDVLVIEFEPAQNFFHQSLSEDDSKEFLRQAGSEVMGKPFQVRIATRQPASPSGTSKTAVASEDPVLQAFARHLGGEVVGGKSKRKTEG